MTPVLDMIGLVASDIKATLAFYRLLGLDFPTEDDGPYVEVATRGGLRISINDLTMIKSMEPDWIQPVGQRIGLAFLCDGPAGVDAKYAEMLSAGHPSHKAPWDAFWGQRYAQVVDPDGNIVDLFAPLEDRATN